MITSSEPLRISVSKVKSQPGLAAGWVSEIIEGEEIKEVPEGQLPAFSVGHDRSCARSLTAMAIASMCIDDHIDLARLHSVLHKSLCSINCVAIYHPTKRAQLMSSFALGLRGNLRQPPNSADWAMAINNLRAYGERDAGAILKVPQTSRMCVIHDKCSRQCNFMCR